MQKKQLQFELIGLFLGLIIGVIIAFGALQQIKNSQRDFIMPYAMGLFALVFASVGYGIGSKIGKALYIEERLGISELKEDGYYKEGRYWIGQTTWTDKRNNKHHKIITRRNSQGILTSTWNDIVFLNHQIPNANQQTVPKHHQLAKNHVFEKLKSEFADY